MTFEEVVQRLSINDQKIIAEIMALYEEIGQQTKEFSLQSGLKCKNGCGACCTNPDIEVTVTEVLPLAVYLWSQGRAKNKLETIESKTVQDICIFYQADLLDKYQGRCGIYAFRPGLCRLFGFAARRDKYGKLALMTCKVIKDAQAPECARSQEELQKGSLTAPLLTAYAFAVANIDPVHGQKLLPINQAFRLAIEKVGYSIK